MNSTFESSVKSVSYAPESIYNLLCDFNNFSDVIQNDKVKDWQSTTDTCRFKVEGVGEVGLRIIDREPFSTIKYTADGKTPFNFYLWVQIKAVADDDSRIKLTIKADMNPMMKMVASQPIQKFLDMLADAIAGHKFN
ncbi:MAG: SRPBCC family protein [Marinilabiliaceae bacterium]|nr:SRPBCC family protein [Marinilabiliaceae bacterium]